MLRPITRSSWAERPVAVEGVRLDARRESGGLGCGLSDREVLLAAGVENASPSAGDSADSPDEEE